MTKVLMRLLLIFASAFLMFSCEYRKGQKQYQDDDQTKYNIVYILGDDMGYQDWGCYGQVKIKTPNIDRLAADGMKFTNHYSGAPVCAPARSVLMTGLHTGHTPVRGNDRDMEIGVATIPKTYPTIAEVLQQDTSYVAALCGRWHLGGEMSSEQPSQRGFDYTFGKLSSFVKGANSFFIRNMFDESGKHKPYEEYSKIGEPVYENGAYYQLTPTEANNPDLYTDELATQKGIDFIKRNKEKPFFLYMAYSLAHTPLEVTEARMKQFGYDQKDWPEEEKVYATMVSMFDEYVARFINTLKEQGLSENTLVIVTSDNGPHNEGGHDPTFFNSNGRLRGMKRDLYEGGIRMPMIAWWPGKVKEGAVSDHISAFWDVMPTVAELAGVEVPKHTDGISFVPELFGVEQKKHEYLYWEFDEILTEEGIEPDYKRAIRKDNWKMLHFIDEDKVELYDLASDPGESNDISDAHPGLVEELMVLMNKAHTPNERFPLLRNER